MRDNKFLVILHRSSIGIFLFCETMKQFDNDKNNRLYNIYLVG